MTSSRIIVLVIVFGLTACSEPVKVSKADAVVYEAAFEAADITPEVQRKWARSCALCHVNGEGGAPRMGDMEVWAPRVEAGDAVLMKHTLEGFNRMPALGYCMDCEMQDFAAMINMMAGKQ